MPILRGEVFIDGVHVGTSSVDFEANAPGAHEAAAPSPAHERMCGRRLAGGVYVEFLPARDTIAARPSLVRTYVFNQPLPINPEQLGVSPIGVTLIERDGVTHIVDWIGEAHYPTAEHFMVEAERVGVSRRLPRNLDWSRLSEESRVLCVHRHHWGHVSGLAIFASFPISALAVVQDTAGGTHGPTLARLRTNNARIARIELVEE
jgi:hypothetical protein